MEPNISGEESSQLVQYNGSGMLDMTFELFRAHDKSQWRALDRSRDLYEDDGAGNVSLQYALVTRYERGKLPYNLHSIVVQSPYLRNFLATVFDGYPGVYTTTKTIKFSAPFPQFYFRWNKFLQCMEQEENKTALMHIRLLYDVMAKIMDPLRATAKDLLGNGLIDFEHLFALFEPGTQVYAKIHGQDRMLITKHYNTDRGLLSCMFIDMDGKSFGWSSHSMSIKAFEGMLPISDLPFIPIQFLADKSIRQRMVDRGRRFEQLNGTKHMAYSGIASIKEKKVLITDGRIVIEPVKDLTPKIQAQMTDEELACCTPEVHAYCLTNKDWGTFIVDNIGDIAWDDHAFDALVLQPEVKKVILSFVQVQLSQKNNFDDIIRGKGKGIVILLQGDAGVGKTLTAESVAEKIRQPLYVMSAGELGITAVEVETNLRRVMDRCTAWRAILLLDECDVFLEKRSESSLVKNQLVAVFLRLLEYYQGVLFLTTNRISAFDPAFESRIHLTIDYPMLDRQARQRIWGNFINAESQPSITADHLRILGHLGLNGRQIKHVVKTAALLATAEQTTLRFEHIETVIKVKGLELHQEKHDEDE
ncbi:hypothetical protein PFICI_08792 [Pestalotiopsis fici W106-1]|uniref:AAA+ ATPase domain-containing protein n=1 Tax=Pestalotiopsis fici (strain W106-1 / CGMCC3.15140) TaxID=1229662 RepID=W3WYS9_PESFW|nr:uncharacterized protein PFICI_08792 [Pestalotiopsis fici W106-1]ETS78939.1 hypothetical protein PFICI_08792 [Pestalotiopsis fici W106-1]